MERQTSQLVTYLVAGGLLCIVELVLVLASLPLLWRISLLPSQPRLEAIERWFHTLARRKTAAIVSCGLAVLVLRITLIPVLGVPTPHFHDEFSFLLAADTYAHGRLTNPTHPMWTHFESFHIIQKPTYMSMYPPGGGMVLAFGQIMGHPWIGQLLLSALMCSALCWMLQGWVPPGWALYGGLLAVFRLGILSFWTNSFFCGSLPALGGALALGALPRLWRHSRLRDALWMALGAVILANSRPYEGFIFCIPIASAVMFWAAKQRRFAFPVVFKRVLLPMTLVLCIAAAGMSYYFWRVTGNPLRMPYQVNRETYAMAPYFVWETPRPMPVYRHAVMRSFYEGWELKSFQQTRTVLGFLLRCADKAITLWIFYLGPLLTLALLGLPAAARSPKMRFPLLLAGVVLLGFAIETWTAPQYAAPATGLLYLFVIQSLRHMRLWRWHGRAIGLSLVRAIPLLAIAMVGLRVAAVMTHTHIETPWPRGNLERAGIVSSLEKISGKSLVIVHYDQTHSANVEWVYNAADIDAAKIVWARDMGDAANQELLHYFYDRQFWIVNADDRTPRPVPYRIANFGSENAHLPTAVLPTNSRPEAP
jgi:hypothetical protein